MKSSTRLECEEAVIDFSITINDNLDNTDKKLCYIGIAGDQEVKGEYAYLFSEFQIETLDADIKWKPDIVCDITKPKEELKLKYDCAIMVQVIEHIPNLFDVASGLASILKDGAYLIIDCPWNYPYHAEPPSFGDYWRITKDGFKELFKEYFEIIEIKEGKNNTSCLMKKNIY